MVKSVTSHFVIVIAGPPGVGKTTISKMLSGFCNCAYLSEDEVAKEVFPERYVNIEDYPDMLKIAESALLQKAKEFFDSGESVVIDLINLGNEFIEETKKAFQKHLMIKVLWSPVETIIERDKKRESWTSGESVIKRFCKKYEELKPIIHEKHYIDNSCQTPTETLEEFIAAIESYKNNQMATKCEKSRSHLRSV